MSNALQSMDHSAVTGLHLGEAHLRRRRHPGRWVAVAAITLIGLQVAQSITTNENFRWNVVGDYLFSGPILDGLRVTITLTVIGMVFGFVLGTVVALMRMSGNPVLRTAAFVYVWLLRGVPLLVQLIFWYNLSALYPQLEVVVPFGPSLAGLETNQVMTAYTAAVLGLGLNQAAYMAEIIRGGIQSVDGGQMEAASTIGLSPYRTFGKIVMPQAMRVILPPTGNETITMLKTTSLVSVVAVADLLYSTQLIYSRNFQTIPLLICASLWYLAMTSVLSVGQYHLERYYGRGTTTHVAEGALTRHRRSRAARRLVDAHVATTSATAVSTERADS